MRKIGDVVSQSSFGIGLDNLTCLKSFPVCFFLLRSHLNLLRWIVAFSIFSGCGLGFLSLGLAFPIYVLSLRTIASVLRRLRWESVIDMVASNVKINSSPMEK
jgi:hypothetical protein